MVKKNDIGLGFAAFQKIFGVLEVPPTIIVAQVAGLTSPTYRNKRICCKVIGYSNTIMCGVMYLNKMNTAIFKLIKVEYSK